MGKAFCSLIQILKIYVNKINFYNPFLHGIYTLYRLMILTSTSVDLWSSYTINFTSFWLYLIEENSSMQLLMISSCDNSLRQKRGWSLFVQDWCDLAEWCIWQIWTKHITLWKYITKLKCTVITKHKTKQDFLEFTATQLPEHLPVMRSHR